MTIFVEYDPQFEVWEVTQAGGMGVLFTKPTRKKAVAKARKYADRGQDVAVKGPRMSQFKSV